MAYSIERMPERISIGRETETGVTDVRIDCSAWVSKWPGMALHAIHTPEGGAPYILQTETDGGVLVWHVTDADTASAGEGQMEIIGTAEGVRKLSCVVGVVVTGRMPGTVGDAPEAAKPWADKVLAAAESVRSSAEEARESAGSAQASAEAAQEAAEGVVTAEAERVQAEQARVQAEQARQEAEKAREEVLPSKLTEPASGLEVGKYFRIAAIDESGHAVLEAVDAPSSPVQDVQVAGTSIVADGVANVPIAGNANVGAQAKYGLVALGDVYNYGLTVVHDVSHNADVLAISTPLNVTIDNRHKTNWLSVKYAPLMTANLDYAVKAAMCDGKGAAWTSDEQAAARERMGLPGDYELIEEIICDETANAYTRNVDPSGNAYDFESVYIEIEIQAGNTYTTVFIRANDESGKCVLYDGLTAAKKNYTSYMCSGCYADRGYYRGWSIAQNIATSDSGGSQSVRSNKPEPIVSPIKKVFVNIVSGTFFAGDKIRIYGVRA